MNKIKKLAPYLLGALVLVIISYYGISKIDYKNSGITCNQKTLELTQDLDRVEQLYFYEMAYVSCMRSEGHLLKGFDFTPDSFPNR